MCGMTLSADARVAQSLNTNNEICMLLSGKQQLHVSCTAGCKQAYGTYRPMWQLLPQEAAVAVPSPSTSYPADTYLPHISCIDCHMSLQ